MKRWNSMYQYKAIAASRWKRRLCGSLCLIVAALGLIGCKVNQEKEQAYYQDVLRGKSAKPPEPLEPSQPLALATALEMANWHNEQLAIKGEEYLQALIDKDRAAANFLPQIAYMPTYTQQQKVTFAGAASIAGDFVPPRAFDQAVNAEMNLNVPGDVANSKRAESAAQRQRSLLLDLKSTILLDVARVYYQVLLAEARVKVLENSVTVQRDRVTDVQNKYKAGTALKLDVVQVEAQLSQTRVSLIKARNDVSTGRATLAFLVNTPSVEGSLADTLQLPGQLPPNEQLLSKAWEYRDDLAAAAYQVETAAHALQQAWSRYFPSISLNFTYFLSRQSFPSDVDWIGALGLNLPIFSAGLIHDDVRTAWSRLRQAKLAEGYLQRQINEQLTVAVEN
ncbi:MAG: TolC family protein, partial [Sedimentisphaerales bacterium]